MVLITTGTYVAENWRFRAPAGATMCFSGAIINACLHAAAYVRLRDKMELYLGLMGLIFENKNVQRQKEAT